MKTKIQKLGVIRRNFQIRFFAPDSIYRVLIQYFCNTLKNEYMQNKQIQVLLYSYIMNILVTVFVLKLCCILLRLTKCCNPFMICRLLRKY